MNALVTALHIGSHCNTAAFAYLDPATTSYVIQIVAGLVIAVGTVLGIYRNKIKRLFKKKTETPPPVEKPEDAAKETITADDILND